MEELNLKWALLAVEVAGRKPDIGQSVSFDHSRLNAMIINGFQSTRLERNGRLVRLWGMVVMGGLEPPTPAL